MLRIPLTSIVIAALLAAHPVAAKNEGNGGGNGRGGENGGGGSQGHGNGGGQDHGNGGGKGNGGNANNGDKGNSSGGGERGGRGGQDSGGSRGGQGNEGQGAGNNRSGGSAEGRGSHGRGASEGVAGGSSSPADAGQSARGGSTANTGGRDNRDARSAEPPAAPRAEAVGGTPAATAASFAAREGMAELNLPSSLIPRLEPSRAERGEPIEVRRMRAGVSGRIVELCRTSIAAAALRYGAIRVDAAGAGQTSRLPGGGLMAPLQVSVVYARANARQIRQSRVACRLNAAGSVVALR